MVMFEIEHRRIKFVIPMPHGRYTENQLSRLDRQRWRCLLLGIKAKLECAAAGITTIENEFLAHIVMPNGFTVSESIAGNLAEAYSGNKMVPLLGPGGVM